MGGEEKEALDIFVRIRSLVSDRLQVISYKWLSRNFSVSSNNAKRLLNEFVEKHGNDLEVLYTISGWSKDNPKSYSVKLASAPKLEETRKEFEEISSVQVYSIQVKIPTDTTVLWNSEFVQAEELFNQPSFEDNCLRDNRFCGVSNSFVNRTADSTKPTNRSPIKPKSDAFQKELQSLKPPKKEQLSISENKTEKDKDNSPAGEQKVNNSKPSVVKEAVKVKGQNGKEKSNSGSIASMFGRANTKPKPIKNESLDDSPSIAGTADAQICAKEDANMIISSDEEQEMNFKSNNSGSNRKRRVIFDFSDEENENENEEEEENVISLASPEPPKRQEIIKNNENVVIKEEKLEIQKEDKKLENKKEEKKLENQKEEKKLENQKEELVKSSSAEKGKELKRRKVLKKRIDERGREVSEFVWEGEEAPSDKTDQNSNTNKDTSNRPPANKTPSSKTDGDRSNTANTKAQSTANKPTVNKKPAKAGAKDAKQGNIMSFFKKI
ncbi:hypothetical protein LUZ60_009358 [Juncus effusus]|nr:hypothetical protein LUZ60_009358 [Juncus effusus]